MRAHVTVEMHGPEAAITVQLSNPSTFRPSFAAATRAFSMTITRPGGTVLTLGPSSWSWGSLTAAGGNAVYQPIATDFPDAGWAVMDMTITLNGTEYPLVSQRIEIRPKTG